MIVPPPCLCLLQTALDFAYRVESEVGRKLETINIGGGLSTSYTQAKEPQELSYRAYRDQLTEVVPELFSGKYRVVTEFGRSLCAKAGR